MRESQQIEWKRSWRDSCLRWICGFANAEGGVLVIGKDDQGRVVGVAEAERLLEDIPNKVRSLLGILVEVNLHVEEGMDLIEIVVEPYPYPISYKGEYHLRSGSTKQELEGAALDHFLLRKQGRHWDGVPAPAFSVDDLASAALKSFRGKAAKSGRLSEALLAEPDPVLLEKLRLLEAAYLKRAAVLLFGEDPEAVILGAYVKVGFFRTNSDLLYHDEVHGSLFDQVEKTVDLVMTKYLRASISYQGLQRVETFPVPELALREAIINAVAHKDYAAAIPIQLSVYPHKLMLWNPGHLPEDWTLEDLQTKHSSRPSHPDIANTFFRAAYMESWGRGLELISQVCLAHNCPRPTMSWKNGLWWEFPFASEAPDKVTVETTVEMPVETTVETTVETSKKTSDRMLDLWKVQPNLTLADVAGAIGKTLRSVERATAKLVQEGRLRHVGPRKGGHWEVME